MDEILERVWDGVGDSWEWLRGVILGEWEDNRSLGQCVTDALAGFVPVVGTVITVRDLDVPPILSSTEIWSPIPNQKEIGREEAFFRRADHRLPA